ncbi:putative membrane protein ActII-3 [Streptomyces mashuensis]|uniref:Membrane protein ActII-3 n=1 Tax=Streptomyces mashuensis TaxID=33904 RepID=A0A919B8N1_9ACTN|nr:MMPL family transporter [Streptomyces mashuensis]GHF71605.1 putative membrane protein ActII-3 [Streptomyces mashuensis]
MIRALTAFGTRHAWKVIIVWTVLGLTLTVASQELVHRVTDSRFTDFLPRGYDSVSAWNIAKEKFAARGDSETFTMLVARTDGAALTTQDRQRVTETATALGRRRVTMPERDGVPAFLVQDRSQTPRITPGETAPDGKFRLLTVSLTGSPDDPGVRGVYRSFRDAARAEFAGVGMRTGFTGGIADRVDASDAQKTTGIVAAAVAMCLIMLLSGWVFRSVLAAVLPLVAVSLASGVAGGLVIGTALLTGTRLDPSTPSVIGVVLLGIGIDYFLFLLFRFREQLRGRERDARTAAADAASRVGTAITSAALTIVVAFATLGTAAFGQFRVLGPAIAVSVLVMLAASLTLMPALLAVCGRRMFWPSRTWRQDRPSAALDRLTSGLTRRPALLAAASAVCLAALAAGTLGMRLDYGQGGGRTHTASAATAAEIARSLPLGAAEPQNVYVAATGTAQPLTTARLAGLTTALTGTAGVGQVAAPVLNHDRSAARIDFFLTSDAGSAKARALVLGPVRTAVARHTPPGTRAHVTGTAAVAADVSTAVDRDMRRILPLAAALVALILLVLLRSVAGPLLLMGAIGLGFAATLGSGTLVFQHLLGRPGVSFTLPLVLFLFVVALGTDYNILVGDRIREEMNGGLPARAGVAKAVRRTAPAVVAAGVVLAGSFVTLAVTPEPSTQQIGAVTAFGVLLSSLVVSVVLVPALAALLGRGFWWPLRRRGTHRTTPPAPTHEGAGHRTERWPVKAPS